MTDCPHGIPVYQYCDQCSGPAPECPDPDKEIARLQEYKRLQMLDIMTLGKKVGALEVEIEKRMADDAMMQARIDELKEALLPFAELGKDMVNENGWIAGPGRVSDWFGPSDFRRAAAVAFASDGGEHE